MKRTPLMFVIPSLTMALTGNIALAQQSTERDDNTDIDEIIVKGLFDEPDRVAGSAHRVDETTLEIYQYNDINRVLNLVPGVYAREEDGVGLRPNIGLRGGSADRSQKVALMEDGVLLSPAPYSAPAAYFFPLNTRMVGVEVYKGPASILYGPQTVGGAINLVSAPIPSGTEAMAELAGGSDGYRHIHARGGTVVEGTGLFAEFVHLGSDGFKELDGGGNTGFEKNELVLKGARDLGPGRLELRISYADEVSDETYLGLTEADFRADPQRRYRASALDRMEWDWLAARADWRQPLLGGTLNVTGYVQEFERAWRKFNNFSGANIRDVLASPDSPFNQLFVNILNGADSDGLSGSPDDIRIGTNDREFSSSGIQSRLRWEFGESIEHALEVGARFHIDRVRRLHDEFGFEQSGGEIFQNDQPRAILTDNTGYTQALALWARDNIDVGRWQLVPGVRVEIIENSLTDRIRARKQNNDYVIVMPGLGALYDVTDSLSLLVGAHKGFSPATPSLNEDLDPEESINYELGFRWATPLGQVEAIGFLNDYSNLTAVCTVSSGCAPADIDTQTNAGEVRTSGLEFGWNHLFQLGAGFTVPTALTYTYTDSEFQEAFGSVNPQFGNVEPGFELPYVPPHRANLNIGLMNDVWGVQVSATYTARMRDVAGRGAFTAEEGSDESTVVDIAGHYRFGDRWTVTGRVDNVADEVYVVSRRPFGARPGKPRTFLVIANYQF
ncbi:MAG: TonB-dependent receptor [Pseudomonadota bacterium]